MWGRLRDWLLDTNEGFLRSLNPIIAEIEREEKKYLDIDSINFTEETARLKTLLSEGKSLDQILPQAYALIRVAATKVVGQRHYPVQLMGGIALHKGMIAEMRTGEGKTLTGTLPVFLNALAGKGVHVVTVNDYLARRDATWMGQIFHTMGLSVAVIQDRGSFLFDPHHINEQEEKSAGVKVLTSYLRPISRKEAYEADITYGTNTEFGFDYLRDNMAHDVAHIVQRDLHFALIDEADSVLIDEARTPLVISGAVEDTTERYAEFATLAKQMIKDSDYRVDEKFRQVTILDAGVEKIEKILNISNLYAPENIRLVHHLEQALKAEGLFHKDKDYVVQNGEVKIIDEFTGRILVGRRYNEGLHQAIEAKEGVPIQKESQTLATITIQNFFRQYQKLAGMTGTALTEAEELSKIYNLEVAAIPPHRPSQRIDHSDQIYVSYKGKINALVKKIASEHKSGRPILVGTASIAKNEEVSNALSKAGIPHNVLNAKNHEREGEIIAQAGAKNAVTIATNMAGRGVDIILGGFPVNPEAQEEVKRLGGLLVIGTERHESRRIDNQLRGRAGRQGDPGETVFFLSLDDDLMRIFGSDKIKSMMGALGMPEDEPIENSMVTKSISSAQKKVEGFHFDTRRHVVQFDDVLAKQREIIYKKRREILFASRNLDKEKLSNLGEKLMAVVHNMLQSAKEKLLRGELTPDDIRDELLSITQLPEESIQNLLQVNHSREEEVQQCMDEILEKLKKIYLTQQEYAELALPDQGFIVVEKSLWLQTIDQLWREHMRAIDHIRAGINLRSYAQHEPIVEFQHEAFQLFKTLLSEIEQTVVTAAFKMIPMQSEENSKKQLPSQNGSPSNQSSSTLGAR